MAGEGRRLLGEHYEKDHLTHAEIEELGLKVVTENGEQTQPEELRDKSSASPIGTSRAATS